MDINSRGKEQYPPRILQYRAQVKIAAFIGLIFLCIVSISMLISLGVFIFQKVSSQNAVESFAKTLVLAIMFLVFLFNYLFLKRLALTKVQVYFDRLSLKIGKKTTDVFFDDIVEIKSHISGNLGGFIKLKMKDKKSYTFTVVLERLDYILDAVIKYQPNLLEQEKYLSLRKKIILVDHKISLFYDLFSKKNRYKILCLTVIIPLLFFTALYFKQSKQVLIHQKFFYFKGLIVWFLCYLGLFFTFFPLVIKRMVGENDLAGDSRDLVSEQKNFQKIFPTTCFLLLVFFAVFYKHDLNSFGALSLSEKTQTLNPHLKSWAIYDSRYNCTDCVFSLKKNDVILTKKGAGVVVALSLEHAELKIKGSDGRMIASLSSTQIPKNNLAIRTATGEVVIIEQEIIKGKLLDYTLVGAE